MTTVTFAPDSAESAGSTPLNPSKRVMHSSRYTVAKVIALTISICLPSASARADEPFILGADQVNQVLAELRVSSIKQISDFITGGDVQKLCLVSTDSSIEVDADGCDVESPSLVAVTGTGQCLIVDLSTTKSRILSGSIEVDCRAMSPSLAITKIDRFGQTHIVFAAE